MNRLFSLDSPVMQFLSKVCDLVIVNILTILCCIPIVTIGSSIAARNYVLLHMARNDESYIVKPFFREFRNNLKQGIVFTVIVLVFAFVMYTYFDYISRATKGADDLSIGDKHPVLYVVFWITVLWALILVMLVLALMARYQNTLKQHLFNAVVVGIAHPFITFGMTATVLFFAFALYCFPQFLLYVYMLFGLSLPGIFNMARMSKVYDQLEGCDPKTHEKIKDADESEDDADGAADDESDAAEGTDEEADEVPEEKTDDAEEAVKESEASEGK